VVEKFKFEFLSAVEKFKNAVHEPDFEVYADRRKVQKRGQRRRLQDLLLAVISPNSGFCTVVQKFNDASLVLGRAGPRRRRRAAVLVALGHPCRTR
jgi:hypothetical protein